MSLAAGTRIGQYDVVAQIGAGGMGEVYRATDTKLKRTVALKVLPAAIASAPDSLARFEREAEILALLNHPNIAHIYGVEEAEGVRALVMELVEGPTLASRIAQGALDLEEALPIARQIADALRAAHEQGIVHRDLKPANVKVRPDGTVKVLDFGLAKAVDLTPASSDASQAPTGVVAPVTHAGVVIGTPAYMSPEQARGQPVDRRTDVWAFGCVLYEMLAGTPAFDGRTPSDTIASLLKSDPEWTRLPAHVPRAAQTLIRHCLIKNPRDRIAEMSTVLFVLDEASSFASAGQGTAAAAVRRANWSWIAASGLVAVMTGAAGVAATWLAIRPPLPRVVRFSVAPTGGAALTMIGPDRVVAVSQDGSRIVYIGSNGTQLFVRPLGALESVGIASGAGLRGPFVSPDGQWVGFVDNPTALYKVAISGGPASRLASLDGVPRGATWLPDDTIVLATNSAETGLQRMPAAGGVPVVLTRPNHAGGEFDHVWPEALPGGRTILFTITAASGGADAAQIAVLDLETNTVTVVIRGGSHAHYVSSGHLVFVAAGMLRAVPFDPRARAILGPAVDVGPRVTMTTTGAGEVSVAADGTLVYVDAATGAEGTDRTLVWVDRSGNEFPIEAPPRPYLYPRLSPDETRIAVNIQDQDQELWIWHLRRSTLTRLTFEPGLDTHHLWTPDGRRILFTSQRSDTLGNMWWQPADGGGTAERLMTSPTLQIPTAMSEDGNYIVFFDQAVETGRDILRLALDGSGRVEPLVRTMYEERNARVSPDGRWLAFESNSSGRFEVYVRPFSPAASGQWQVSTAGARQPLWSRRGDELFFWGADGALMGATVERTPDWNAGTPMKLLEPRYYTGGANQGRNYDISADGRFLMVKAPGTDATATPPSIIVVQNFGEELKRRAPAHLRRILRTPRGSPSRPSAPRRRRCGRRSCAPG